jgi:translation initiation factor 3 subunit A
MMANYYEKLARILLVGESYLFHAAAWSRYYAIVRQNRSVTEEEHQRMTSMVILSALSIPIIQTGRSKGGAEDNDSKEKVQRLANLLKAPRPPTRDTLLRDALSKTVSARIRPELKELYDILEVQFDPLTICKKIAPIMQQLQANAEFSKYVGPIHQIILTRLLQQVRSGSFRTNFRKSLAHLSLE